LKLAGGKGGSYIQSRPNKVSQEMSISKNILTFCGKISRQSISYCKLANLIIVDHCDKYLQQNEQLSRNCTDLFPLTGGGQRAVSAVGACLSLQLCQDINCSEDQFAETGRICTWQEI